MTRLTKQKVIDQTEGGLKLFQILLPELKMVGDRNTTNIDSPVSKGKKCLSVYKYKSIYYYKDHYTGKYGDIFEFVAQLNKLDSKEGFKQTLEIITELLNESHYQIPVDKLKTYYNQEDDCVLTIVNGDVSDNFIEAHFKKAMSYLDSRPLYQLNLVKNFSIVTDSGQVKKFEFDYSKPNDAFYALTITEGQFYILFNPLNQQCYQWGKQKEFYVLGLEHLFEIAYTENIYLRETLVLTNSIIGLLFLQDKGIPCLALVNHEIELPDFFHKLIAPLFPDRFLLLDLGKKMNEQSKLFMGRDNFKMIRRKETYLTSFFNKHSDAIDYIMDNFEMKDGFEYLGQAHRITEVAYIEQEE